MTELAATRPDCHQVRFQFFQQVVIGSDGAHRHVDGQDRLLGAHRVGLCLARSEETSAHMTR